MPVFVLLLFLGIVEISVLVLVGQTIGVLPTIGLLLAAAALGTWLLRREGRRTLREFSEAARLRRPPAREVSDGVLIAAGGILIVVPGLVSDVAGILCLLPPTRALLRNRLQRAAERRTQALHEQMRAQAAGGYPAAGYAGGRHGPRSAASNDEVIDGEVVSVDEDEHRTEDRRERPYLPPTRGENGPATGPGERHGG